jgi:hypothetical protein
LSFQGYAAESTPESGGLIYTVRFTFSEVLG